MLFKILRTYSDCMSVTLRPERVCSQQESLFTEESVHSKTKIAVLVSNIYWVNRSP